MLCQSIFALLTTVVTAAAAQPPHTADPCNALCIEFSAPFRGEGQNLCDSTESSRCIDSVCTHLYWSNTEEGEIGLVYSLTGSDLIGTERSSPVSCEQAVQMTSPPSLIRPQETSMNFFNTALEVFIRLPVIQRHLVAGANETHSLRTRLLDHIQDTVSLNGTGFMPPSSQPIIDHLAQQGVNVAAADLLPLLVMRALTREFGFSTGLIDTLHSQFVVSLEESMACPTCNQSRVTVTEHEVVGLSATTGVMETLHLQEAITRMPSDRWNLRCEGCTSVRYQRLHRRIINSPELLTINYPRYIEETSAYMITNVQIPFALDLSPITQTGNGNYRLVATIHRESLEGDYFANFLDQSTGQWFQYRNDIIRPIQFTDNTLSSTATTFFYHRIA